MLGQRIAQAEHTDQAPDAAIESTREVRRRDRPVIHSMRTPVSYWDRNSTVTLALSWKSTAGGVPSSIVAFINRLCIARSVAAGIDVQVGVSRGVANHRQPIASPGTV